MSFSKMQKSEILSQTPKSSCCRRAMLHGILTAKGELTGGGTVCIRADIGDAVDLVKRLVSEFFGRDVSVCTSKTGGRCRTLTFESAAAERMLSDMWMDGTLTPPFKCEGCKAGFLQGLFLAAGRISDPSKQYCLEFSLGKKADMFWKALGALGIFLKISHKEAESVLYTKNSSTIEDFFVLAGMNMTAFSVMNSKIKGDIRNGANRVANCETNNIEKSVSASGRQINAILQLEQANLLSSLPQELEKTARLRLQYRDLSLSELAAVSVPPISKSGLSHRMKRIMAFYDEMHAKG